MNVGLYCYQYFDCYLFFFVGGTAGAFSRITGSLGQAVATLTFDSNFQMVSRQFSYCICVEQSGKQTNNSISVKFCTHFVLPGNSDLFAISYRASWNELRSCHLRTCSIFCALAKTSAHAQTTSRCWSGTVNGRKESVDGKLNLRIF